MGLTTRRASSEGAGAVEKWALEASHSSLGVTDQGMGEGDTRPTGWKCMPCTSIWAFGYGCALFIAVMGPSHGVVVQQE
jgi:hypothetical protein